jgi:hypothetical protein
MRFCARCDSCRWVCEAHPERPWLGPRACSCAPESRARSAIVRTRIRSRNYPKASLLTPGARIGTNRICNPVRMHA